MRREQFIARHDYDAVDVAAVWPTSAQLAPFPIPQMERMSESQEFRATPAAPDVPAVVGGMVAASYAALIIALAIATIGPGESGFMLAIAALFVTIFFGVPRIFFAVEQDGGVRASLRDFLRDGMDTCTGHNSGTAALVQMLIVPLLLTLAVLAMGIVIAMA